MILYSQFMNRKGEKQQMDPLQNTSRKKMILIVFVIIIIQLGVSTYFMAAHKNGYYADDMYSYGFANSDDQFTPLQTKGEDIIQYNTWHDGRELYAYLTVAKDEIFAYDRIVHILENDAHPPLFYFLLHFMCSLTPNVFSKWSGFVINVFAFILLQVFLYRLTLFISRSRCLALLTMTMFGFSSAVVNVMSLIRMYMLGTALVMTFTFYTFRYVKNTDKRKPFDRNLLFCFISLYLASMTVYIGTIYAFLLTLCVSVMMLAKKEIKKMFCFGLSMLASVGLMLLSFPTFFIQMNRDQPALMGASGYPFLLQLRMGIHVIMNGLFGMNTPIFASMLPLYFLWSCIAIIIVYLILRFLFREDAWFLSFRKKTGEYIKRTLRNSLPYLYFLVPVFLCSTLMLLYFATSLKLYYYRYDGMRYLFILTPFYTMLIFTILFKLIKKNAVRIPVVILLIVFSLLLGNKNFLEEKFETKELARITTDADVVVVEEQAIVFMYHVADILNCNRFYYTNPKSIYVDIPRSKLAGMKDNGRELYLMVDLGAGQVTPEKTISIGMDGKEQPDLNPYHEAYYYFKSIPDFSNIEYIGDFGTCFLYKLK